MSRSRRRLLLGLAALQLALPAGARARTATPAVLEGGEWAAFRARFVRPDGRVVDTGNGGISHSEGQGWALLCAERAGDREGFERIWGWTRRTLQRRGDALFAWRFRPDGPLAGVDDPNNATDGDLMIAWALLRAGARWGTPEYAEAGAAVGRDILRLLVRQVGEEVVLLPGAAGFEQPAHVTVNLSYYAFPAIRALARAVPDPLWLRVAGDGIGLIRRARFGRWGLPPDWLALPRIGGRPQPAPGWPPRFSYDAVRVPLYLAWAGLGREPVAEGAARFWTDPAHSRVPAWTDLSSDAVSPYAASAGIRAIARLAVARSGDGSSDRDLPGVGDAKDYYSAVLTLLARLAARDSAMAAI
jgi:endoglucanase